MEAKKKMEEQQKPLIPKKSTGKTEEETENLGLDADHSSDTAYYHLNNDNDRISGNPDGETDEKDGSGSLGQSPLLEK